MQQPAPACVQVPLYASLSIAMTTTVATVASNPAPGTGAFGPGSTSVWETLLCQRGVQASFSSNEAPSVALTSSWRRLGEVAVAAAAAGRTDRTMPELCPLLTLLLSRN